MIRVPFVFPEAWQAATAANLGLEFTFRQRGRPKKEGANEDK